MSATHDLLIDTIRDHLERRESLEQPGLTPTSRHTALKSALDARATHGESPAGDANADANGLEAPLSNNTARCERAKEIWRVN